LLNQSNPCSDTGASRGQVHVSATGFVASGGTYAGPHGTGWRSHPGSRRKLQLSRKTVSSHVEHIDAKLGVKPWTGPRCPPCAAACPGWRANPEPDKKIGQLPDSPPLADP
jgi:hypothetical protein